MVNTNLIISPALLSYPKFKTEKGIKYKLESFEVSKEKITPIYIETDEVDDEEALNIILGGAE